MSAETITTAIFLITAVVATAVLVNAIYPVIYTTAGTFQSSTHDADTRLRTDFKIVATFATPDPGGYADIYMKNVGSQRISLTEIQTAADVFCGTTVGNRLSYGDGWTAEIFPAGGDIYWDIGETLHVHATTPITSGGTVYFQFILPNGIWRSQEFNAELS
jgi:flagellar protein FlaG